jgi:D-tyrosyl-tRNA(Tyr) deacylase|tara:strand:+ start:1881 stop:2318 length:438 start_codon:yes stop_codon:yes gene_type:complete
LRALIQRVSEAQVTVDGNAAGAIGQGLLVLLGVQKGDDVALADKLMDKLLAYRIFNDDAGKMNLSVNDLNAGVLLVSQFTLAADTKKGLRPGFSTAAAPADAEVLYDYIKEALAPRCKTFGSGVFGADMKVALVNDGPVTFLLEV